MQRLSILTLVVMLLPLTWHAAAQQPTPSPVTLVPQATSPVGVLATNTPRPPTATPNTPDLIDMYALRLWTPDDLVGLLEAQLADLVETGSPDAALAARLALYELVQRYPSALDRESAQARLLPLLLRAPRGSVDMRPVVYPYLERLITDNRTLFDPEIAASYTVGHFTVSVQPVNATPQGNSDVILIVTNGETSGTPFYESVIFGRFSPESFAVIPARPDYPAAPIGDITGVRLMRVGDLNADRAEEIAVAVTRAGALNQTLQLYAVRTDAAYALTTENVNFTGLPVWAAPNFTVNELHYREASFWGCAEQQSVTWMWGNNVYYPQRDNGAAVPVASLACRLDEIGNLFDRPPGQALAQLTPLIDGADPAAEPDTLARAHLLAAMLHALDGQPALAATRATRAFDFVPKDSPRWTQAQTLLRSLNANPLVACSQVSVTTPDPLCDVDAVVTRLLAAPFALNDDLAEQLRARQLPVERVIMLEALGRRARPAAHLPLGDGIWLAFNVTENTYTVEFIPPPPGFAPPPPPPPPRVAALNETIIARLFGAGDRTAVVTAIDSLEANPTYTSLALDLRFVRALANDLAGNRQVARQQYYDLWANDPDSVWGRLAARHLERR